jgi:hypothetical protein
MHRRRLNNLNVRFGSWLCKNAPTRNCDRIDFSTKRLSGALGFANAFYFGSFEKKNLVAFRIFEFLYSQGQRLKGSQRVYRVRSTPMTGRNVATQRFSALGQKVTSAPFCSNDWTGNVQTKSKDQRGKP